MADRFGYNVYDWFWVVGDTNPTTQVYSTAANAFVANNAAAYSTWLASGLADVAFGYIQAISAMADNGSGKVRLTMESTSALQTNQRWYFRGLDGTPLANGLQQITVVDATTIDITAIAFVASTLASNAALVGATVIGTLASLTSYINSVAALNWDPLTAPVDVSIAVNYTATNPPTSQYFISPSVPGLSFTFPAMNTLKSLPIGQKIRVLNTNAVEDLIIKDAAGTTIDTLPSARGLEYILIGNQTAAGTFIGIGWWNTRNGDTTPWLGGDSTGVIGTHIQHIRVAGGIEFNGVGIRRSALTGDVTASAGSNATTIANDAVTFAKMANIATDSLIGRDTAGSGDPENITLNATLSMTGAGALQRAALTGDVTASAGSNATTVANDAVTFAKMQNIATDRLVGRDAAGSGDPEEVQVTNGLGFTGSTSIGILNYSKTTFTPGISFGGGTTGITYTSRDARVSRLADRVNVEGLIILSNKGSSTGGARITGLPHTTQGSVPTLCMVKLNSSPTAGEYFGVIQAGTTTIDIEVASGGNVAQTDDTYFDNDTIIYFSASYEAA